MFGFAKSRWSTLSERRAVRFTATVSITLDVSAPSVNATIRCRRPGAAGRKSDKSSASLSDVPPTGKGKSNDTC